MDKDFQTSFIPKKPMIEKRIPDGKPINFFTVISLFIFFTMLLSTGVLFFYKESIKKNIAQMQNDLELSRKRFDSAKIKQFQVLDNRLKASTEILGKHVSVTPIFQALEDLTMKSVRYTKFSYELGTPDQPNILVKMSGIAVGYRSVALQSDLYAKNKNIIDPIFSKLSLDDSGNVIFDLNFSVDPNFLNYKIENAVSASTIPVDTTLPADTTTDTAVPTNNTTDTTLPTNPVNAITPPSTNSTGSINP